MNFEFDFLLKNLLSTPQDYELFFSKEKLNNIKVLDLFCGCGGISLGFKRAGFKIVAGIDNDEDSLKTFKNNISNLALNINMFDNNFLDIIKDKIPKDSVDVIVGGPPCQGFSLTGTRIFEDPRNKLYQAFFKVVDYYKPKLFLIENVKGMSSLYKGEAKKRILNEINKRNYVTNSAILNSAFYGVPQSRERLFIIASRINDTIEFPNKIFSKDKFITCKEAISDLPSLENHIGEEESVYKNQPQNFYQKIMRENTNQLYNHVGTIHKQFVIETIKLVPDGGNYKDLPEGIGTSRRFNEAWTRYNSQKPSRTIDTGHRNHFHYEYNRVPTVRENARLQSFPDNFIFFGSKTSQNRQVGNAVPVFLAQTIGKHLSKYIKSD